jgi:hypothetical protein
MITSNRRVRTNVAVVTASVFLSVLVTACASREEAPVVRYEVRLEADARTQEACRENVAVRFEPVSVAPQVLSNLYQMTTFTQDAVITDKPVLDGPDNWECWLTYRSPALSPGKWKIVGEFSNGTQSCLRDVGPGLPDRVRIDQEDGCVDFESEALDGAGQPRAR